MKSPRTALCSLLFALCLMAAGCQRPAVPTQATDERQTASASSLAAPSIVTYAFADKWTENDVDRCLYGITYPELTYPSTWIQKEPSKSPILERANREILIAYGLLSATSTVALNPEEIAREFIDLCKSDLTDMTSQLGPESVENITYIDDSSFTVHLLTPNIASLSIETYQYTGGAHGNPGIQSVTLDLTTGKRMTLGDIIKNDQLQTIIKMAYAIILKNNEEGLLEEARSEMNTAVNSKSIMTASEQKEKFGSAKDFFLTGEGLMFFWNAYEIAPYAAGQPMALISWSDLNDKLLIKQP